MRGVHMDKNVLNAAVLAALLLSACGGGGATKVAPGQTPTQGRATLQVMGHDSFNMSESVLEEFETANNVDVQILKAGDTGTALNKAILAKADPLADVFYGVDNTFLSRALEEGIFESYDSPLLTVIPDRFKLDPQNRALPVDYGDVCLNYDIEYMQANGLAPPAALDDLLDPEYQGLLVVENPATSSPGLAFLFTTIAVYGEDGFIDYWRGLLDNGVLIVNDWETAYYSEFSGGTSEGARPIVVSYASSPPFEVIYAEEPIEAPTTAAVVADDTCFRQIEFVGILTGTERRRLAEAWVDFMLSPTFQEDIPLQMFVFPVNPEAKLDETFVRYLKVPEKPVTISPDLIAEKREAWIQEWTEAILR
jgi:thiamine transport system substrate-binding protein